MPTVLVRLDSGAGIVRLDNGRIVLRADVTQDGGISAFIGEHDRYRPQKCWVDDESCLVGGLLPPGAVSAEVVDERGTRIAAVAAEGAYVARLDEPSDGDPPVVWCRAANGMPARRPWVGTYPSVRVTDAVEPCPACGAMDWDEYQPSERWRGGSVLSRRWGLGRTVVPSPVVSCRSCGHEEVEGVFTRSTRVAAGRLPEADEAAMRRAIVEDDLRRWHADAAELRSVTFPVYAAEGWPARLGGRSGRGDRCTEVTVHHGQGAAPEQRDTDLRIATAELEPRDGPLLHIAGHHLESRVREDATERWPDVSDAAKSLWLSARRREQRAAVLDATRSEQMLRIDDRDVPALMLTAASGSWVAVGQLGQVTVTVAARAVDPAGLRLGRIDDLVGRLLGPEPPAA